MRAPPHPPSQQKRWPSLLALLIILVVVAEITYLGRIDLAEKATIVEQWTASFYFPVAQHEGYDFSLSSSNQGGVVDDGDDEEFRSCVERLERLGSIGYERDFDKVPILVNGGHEDWKSCSVGCKFGYEQGRLADAAFGLPQESTVAGVHRSMESSHYYPENNVDTARGRGYKIVMTTSLSSDVPVGYFSWAEYDIMAPVRPKTEEALAAAFISNCGARNFRLQALEMLEQLGLKIDSYGHCHRNRDGSSVDKVEALKRYKFSLAFENSNEEDYVTEKFFQSLVAGAIPVVIGAPNIQDFAPSADSLLHIKELSDVATVAKTMENLASNPAAFNKSLEWKYKGPSDSFKALVDMAAVHSSCRLCIHIATKIHEEEEKGLKFKNRPCSCNTKKGTVYHLFVRERGRFQFESIYLRSDKLTLEALDAAVLAKFKLMNHIPIWKEERPASIRGGDELKIYRVHPVGLTQRQALYTFRFKDNEDFERHIKNNPCAKFELIFV